MPGSEPTDSPDDAEGVSTDALEDPPADAEPPLDENLIALAEAEAEIEQVESRFLAGDASLRYEAPGPRLLALQRRRGRAVWGVLSFGCVLAAWAAPAIEWTTQAFLRRTTFSAETGITIVAVGLLAAIVSARSGAAASPASEWRGRVDCSRGTRQH